MPAPPKVFISAVSGDLRGVRQVVKEALLTIGCHPVEQTNFAPDWRTAGVMPRGKIEECQALIHIAGMRYGAEPNPATLPPGTARRSYTQMEYDIGRALQRERGDHGFRVYTFVCPPDFPYDQVGKDGGPLPAEDDALRRMQEQHRAALLADPHLYEQPADIATIQTRVTALREEALTLQIEEAEVKREVQTTRRSGAWAVAAILLVLAGIGYWQWQLKRDTSGITKGTAEVLNTLRADLEQLRVRLLQQIEEKATADLAAERSGKNDWRTIDEIEKRRQTALSKVDDIIANIRAGLTGTPEPVLLKATRILEADGSAKAIAYIESQEASLLDELARLTGSQANVKQRRQETLRPLLLKAKLYEAQLELDTAVVLLEQIVVQEPEWLEARDQLGKLLYSLARYSEAEVNMRVAATLATTDDERASTLNNLALLLQDTNRLAEAEPLMRRALAIDEASLGEDHPNVAVRLNNLALLLQDTNQLPEAESLMQRALAINEACYGRNHPKVAMNVTNLARLLQATNRLTEAELLMQRALSIFEASYGWHDTEVAVALNNLAALLQATGRLAEAEPLYQRALSIDEASFGARHPIVARDLNNVALALQKKGDVQAAEAYFRRALEIDEKSFGPDHPGMIVRTTNLALLLEQSGRFTEASELGRKAARIVTLNKLRGVGGYDAYDKVRANYAHVLQSEGKTKDQIEAELIAVDEWAKAQVTGGGKE